MPVPIVRNMRAIVTNCKGPFETFIRKPTVVEIRGKNYCISHWNVVLLKIENFIRTSERQEDGKVSNNQIDSNTRPSYIRYLWEMDTIKLLERLDCKRHLGALAIIEMIGSVSTRTLFQTRIYCSAETNGKYVR